MRKVMAEAEVGDDVYGEDPTINRLEEITENLLGKEAAIFSASGTQSNLLALLSHCERGDEYIVGQLAHTYKYEGGGAAVLGSIQPQPLDLEEDGTIDLEKIDHFVKPDNFHFARTKLLCLENTHNGNALPPGYFPKARECADRHGLKMHLDGARIFNASIQSGVELTDIGRHFDSVSICLSKGLGAPVGAILCGSSDFIDRARRWRKVLGGGMRQAGIVGAAGIFALENNIDRLREDHENARLLADGLRIIPDLEVEYGDCQTNMVFITIPDEAVGSLQKYLREQEIVVASGKRIRLVTHLDIGRVDIDKTVRLVQAFFRT